MSDTLAARLRELANGGAMGYYVAEEATLREAAALIERYERKLRELCNERKWCVMLSDGRMEDAILAVDVLRVLDSQRGENE